MKETSFPIQITDDDIEWVQALMPDVEFDDCRVEILKNMEPVDIHACPGSGKTTLLVAKLAILANKWEDSHRGICVLSHTNVAREEIQERLGKTKVGKKLLTYPHFIGTFQSFFDIFVVMPWLRSFEQPVNIVDTDYVTERRWKSLWSKTWLEKKGKDKSVCDPVGLPYKLDISCSEKTNTYKDLIRVIKESRLRGEFTFNEMQLWAARIIEIKPIMRDIMQERFPILFIDEAQDTKSEIWEMVNSLYRNSANGSFYQAYGDSNQAIFDSYEKMGTLKYFPRENALSMLNSKRFTPQIAQFANSVALD